MKDKAIKDAMNVIKNIIGYVYNQGYNDGIEFSNEAHAYTGDYERGLNDAWECAKKIYSLSAGEIINIFGGCSTWVNYSASEAIAKIKEYEEKQKPVEDAEIKVGDEVIYHDGGAHDGSVGVVVGAEKDWRWVRFKFGWSSVGVHKDSLTRTGRNFSQIEEVLEQLKGEE